MLDMKGILETNCFHCSHFTLQGTEAQRFNITRWITQCRNQRQNLGPLDSQSRASRTSRWWCPVLWIVTWHVYLVRYPEMRKITFQSLYPYFLQCHTRILNLLCFNASPSTYRVKGGLLIDANKITVRQRKGADLGRFSKGCVQMWQPAGLVMWVWKTSH